MAITLDQRPIFVTGSERSGTTLIMAILGCHPRLAVPEVSWYYPRFRPYLFTYGDLAILDHVHPVSRIALLKNMLSGGNGANPGRLLERLEVPRRHSLEQFALFQPNHPRELTGPSFSVK